jgi:hypothetical protein
VLEILEANDWASSDDADADLEIDLDDDDDFSPEHGFKLESDELEREMFGLRSAIEAGGGDGDEGDDPGKGDEDEELKVQELEGLMERIRGIRGMFVFVSVMTFWGCW